MRRGICPKCDSKTVYATNIQDLEFSLPKFVSKGIVGKSISAEKVDCERYVCITCGYFEMYVADRDFLNFLPTSDIWIKV
jgi:hypothetical protein